MATERNGRGLAIHDYEAGAVRDTLHYVSEHRGKAVLVVQTRLGTIRKSDIDILLWDLEQIHRIGMRVILGESKGDGVWEPLAQKNHYELVCLPPEDPAAAIAKAMQRHNANRLCFLCGADAIYSASGPINSLSLAEAAQAILNGHVKGDGAYVLRLALDVCQMGIARVHLVNAHRQGALLVELFTGHGSGTMIYADDARYKATRAGQVGDLRSLATLKPNLFGNVRPEHAEDALRLFKVFTVDNEVHGCVRTERVGTTIVLSQLVYSLRFNGAEILESLMRAVILDARATPATKDVIIPSNEVPPLISIQPWLRKLGFEKTQSRLGPGKQEAWVHRLA